MATSSGYTEIDWYDVPLYYDIIFSRGTDTERDFLLEMRKRHGLPSVPTVLEPACGSGRLVAALAEGGLEVRGFDLNPAMVAFAKARLAQAGLEASVSEGRMEAFHVAAPVGLAHNLVSTFKYLLTEADAVSHLQHVARALLPGGVYVLGFHLTDYADTQRSRERWCERRGAVRVTCNIQTWPADREARLEQVRSRLVVRQGRKSQQLETVWAFRTYDAQEVRDLLGQVPELEHVATYDFDCDPGAPRTLHDDQLDVILILRRR